MLQGKLLSWNLSLTHRVHANSYNEPTVLQYILKKFRPYHASAGPTPNHSLLSILYFSYYLTQGN